jgi:hypothetical protein
MDPVQEAIKQKDERRNGKPSEAMVRRVVTRPARSIRPESVKFAWNGRVPLGAFTLLAGEGGLGKSTVLSEVHAQLSRGTLEGDLYGKPVQSLLVTSRTSPTRWWCRD